MKKNDKYRIEINGMTDEGFGVGRADGIAVFVPYTIVGETVLVRIIKVKSSYAVARLEEIIKPSVHRVKAECEYFRKCGGCALWHMDYEAELEYKQTKVEDCILRIAECDVKVSPIISARDICRYRNKAMLPVSKDGIGFYKRNSHTVIDMADCLLQDRRVALISKAVREWIEEYKIPVYDEKNGKGLIRNIYTRTGKDDIMLVIVATDSKLPHKDELIAKVKNTDAKLCGIVLNVNRNAGNSVLGKRNIVIYGTGSIVGDIRGLKFNISPNSFFQVNTEQTEKLYSVAKQLADLKGYETVWDLYCGIGTIGQFMADKAKKIVGVEIVPQAVEDAKKNAARNGIANAEYYCGVAENLVPELVKMRLKPNVVILDPPRKGCDEKLLDAVCGVKPDRIIYISCKPSTLARDLKYIAFRGYAPSEIIPVDMFPRTPHVETVVLLSHKKPDAVVRSSVWRA